MTVATQVPRRSESEPSARDTYLLVLPWDLRGDVGGVSQVVQSIYDGIARDGRLDPRALVLHWDAATPIDEHDAAGRSIVRFRLLSLEHTSSFVRDVLRYVARLPRELWRLRKFVKQYRVSIVNCHFIGSSDLMWAIAKSIGLFRGKIFLSIHGRDIRTLAAHTGLRWHLWRWVLQRSDAVVACSEGLATETIENLQLPASQVVMIHNGFDIARLSRFLDTDDQPSPPAGRGPSLLNLGTFEHKKGHDILLHAFKSVLDRFPTAHLTIMGRRAETFDQTDRLVDELGLRAHVTIRFDVPHHVALQVLKESSLFVLPSRNEAFSVALLEAGAFGKPIVATNVCGVAELIEDRVTGVLVPSEDVAELARGILSLLDDPQTATEYGRRLRERVVTAFSAEQTSLNYLRLAGYASRDANADRTRAVGLAGGYVAHGRTK